jgi:ABC-type polysaccharide/polyol phosphate transport system, ATPase component
MPSTVINVAGLGKRYWIQHRARPRYRALRDEIVEWASWPFRVVRRAFTGRGSDPDQTTKEEAFWALREVSFEVQQGDVVGIIGSNGAGKSTLLKVLSRITEPTEGRIEIQGRVASLLEVGTGFHPELTGRENVFLNGAILGMTRAEIRKKFDEIVAFAEVEKFLDTPVKRYSSGMYVRLAFAVAAHLEPEILIVDEVLAVGDAQFQKKCLGKMHDVSAKEGRTVLFVSHQMGTIRQLCTRGILLKAGRIAKSGCAREVIQAYMDLHMGGKDAGFSASPVSLTADIAIEWAATYNHLNEMTPFFVHSDPITVQISCLVNRWIPNAELRLLVDDSRGRRVFTSDVALHPSSRSNVPLLAQAKIPPHFLRPATYSVTLCTFVHNQVIIQSVPNAFTFVVQDGGTKYAASEGLDYGCVFSPCEWTVAPGDKREPVDTITPSVRSSTDT